MGDGGGGLGVTESLRSINAVVTGLGRWHSVKVFTTQA